MLVSFAIALFVCSFVSSVILTALARKVAPRIGLVAHPKADRYHRSIIPLGGGMAVFGTLALFLMAGAATMRFLIVPGYFGRLAASCLSSCYARRFYSLLASGTTSTRWGRLSS